MKIIFLDMDGVLNGSDWGVPYGHPADMGSERWWANMVNPMSVAILNRLIAQTGASIVISSSWRYHVSPSLMQGILNLKGLKGHVISRTPLRTELPTGLRDETRGTEIEYWLVKNRHLGIKSFVILDDMSAAQFGEMAPYLVRTDMVTGIVSNDVDKAISVLRNPALHPNLKE